MSYPYKEGEIPVRLQAARQKQLNDIRGDKPESDDAKAFRLFIIRDSTEPEKPYFDHEGGYLSLFDLYREVINQTPLGIEQEKIWGDIVAGRNPLRSLA